MRYTKVNMGCTGNTIFKILEHLQFKRKQKMLAMKNESETVSAYVLIR